LPEPEAPATTVKCPTGICSDTSPSTFVSSIVTLTFSKLKRSVTPPPLYSPTERADDVGIYVVASHGIRHHLGFDCTIGRETGQCRYHDVTGIHLEEAT
jgi:hypothetical protein